MNLIIDAGNTKIKWAVYQNGQLLEKQIGSVWDDFDLSVLLSSFPEISKCMLSSTRAEWPQLESVMQAHSISLFRLNHQMSLPIRLVYDTPETLGLDRIAGAAGAQHTFPGENVLIIDAGTAITYDVLSSEGLFLGGNISPGIEIRFRSLNRYTDNLPLVEFNEKFDLDRVDLLGSSTEGAIQAGVQNGILYEITSYINTLINKYNGLRVILTGGTAEYFVKKLKKTIFVDPNLVLKGLNHILEHQTGLRLGDENNYGS